MSVRSRKHLTGLSQDQRGYNIVSINHPEVSDIKCWRNIILSEDEINNKVKVTRALTSGWRWGQNITDVRRKEVRIENNLLYEQTLHNTESQKVRSMAYIPVQLKELQGLCGKRAQTCLTQQQDMGLIAIVNLAYCNRCSVDRKTFLIRL